MRRDEIRARLAAAKGAPEMEDPLNADDLACILEDDSWSPPITALLAHAPIDLALLLEAADRLAALVALLERGCEVGNNYSACCSRRCENAAEDEASWLRAKGLL